MSAYAETSALRHLLIMSDATVGVRQHLAEQGVAFTSSVSVTELHRLGAWQRLDVRVVDEILARFDPLPVTDDLCRRAGLLPHLPGSYLRSLNALHIASALDVAASSFVTYDRRQARAAAAVGLRVVSPGMPQDWYESPPPPPAP